MSDCVFKVAVLLIPLAGQTVQNGRRLGALGQESGAQDVREEMVVTEPLPVIVQRYDKEVGSLQ